MAMHGLAVMALALAPPGAQNPHSHTTLTSTVDLHRRRDLVCSTSWPKSANRTSMEKPACITALYKLLSSTSVGSLLMFRNTLCRKTGAVQK
jgi:hypothetical protein